MRDGVMVHEGKISSLRRFKDDVSEVKAGFECGIAFDKYNDVKVGDVIEVFTVERIAVLPRRQASGSLKRQRLAHGRRPLSIEFHIPGARSLKDKRMVLRSVKDRIKKFNVAVAEVEYHDLWQRAGLSVVTVSNDEKHADRELAAVVNEIERLEPGLITRTEVEFLG